MYLLRIGPFPACSKIPVASLGKTTPLLMLDGMVEKERCIPRMKVACALGQHGNHPSVLDGSAGASFHPEPSSEDRLSSGQEKFGKRRRDEEGDGHPRRNTRRLA